MSARLRIVYHKPARWEVTKLRLLADGKAVVPAIWTLEIANVLLVAERRARLARAEREQFITLLEKLPIVIDTVSICSISPRILALGRDYQLSS